MNVTFREARHGEHKTILKIAQSSKFTRDYGSIMFSSEHSYKKGWVRVAVNEHGAILGFTCRRDKVRQPETVLYFVTVAPDCRQKGLGWRLIKDMMKHAKHEVLTLNCHKDNEAGLAFYRKNGFQETGTALDGDGFAFRKEFPK